MSSEEDVVEEGEPEEYEYDDEWEESEGFTPSGSLDAPAFKSWREQADNARAEREELIMAAAAQAAPHLRKKMSAEELMESAERQHAKRDERDKKLKEKKKQLERQTGSLHSDKKAVWDGEGGLVSRLYKPSPQSRRTGSHQGHVNFSAALRGSSPAASSSPRTPRTLAVKPGSTKKTKKGGGSGAAAAGAAQLPAEGAEARELVMAKAEREGLKKRLEEVTAELELAKTESEGAAAAKEALLEAQAELQVSRQEEERLAAAAKAMEQRLQAVLAAAKAQGMDLAAVDGLGGGTAADGETSPESAEEDEDDGDSDGVTTMEIQCPEGVEAGDTIALETPDGDQIELQIPEGVEPGDVFAVQIS
jgi:hypothetical protein